MSKIFEGEIKLNAIQVLEKLKGSMTSEQRKVLAQSVSAMGYQEDPHIKNYKRFLAHSILDAYRHIKGSDENQTMEVRKCLKHVMERYMKSTVILEGEESATKVFLDWTIAEY